MSWWLCCICSWARSGRRSHKWRELSRSCRQNANSGLLAAPSRDLSKCTAGIDPQRAVNKRPLRRRSLCCSCSACRRLQESLLDRENSPTGSPGPRSDCLPSYVLNTFRSLQSWTKHGACSDPRCKVLTGKNKISPPVRITRDETDKHNTRRYLRRCRLRRWHYESQLMALGGWFIL